MQVIAAKFVVFAEEFITFAFCFAIAWVGYTVEFFAFVLEEFIIEL